MQGAVRRTLAATILGLVCSWAQGAETGWQTQYMQALTAYQAGALDQAAAAASAALKLAEQGKGETAPYVASTLNLQAQIQAARGETAAAVTLLQRALRLSEQSLGAHMNTASMAFNLGNLLADEGQLAAARTHYERGLEIAQGLPASPEQASLAVNLRAALGRVYAALGDTEAAAAQAATLLRQQADLPPLVRADALQQQALSLAAEGQTGAAVTALEQALQLRRQALGEQDLRVAQTLGELALMLSRDGRGEDAAERHRQALALREQWHPEADGMAGHLNELALWHMAHSQWQPAQDLLQRALVRVRQEYGAQSVAEAQILSSQAHLQEQLRHDTEAQANYEQALAIFRQHGQTREAVLGQARVLNQLALPIYRKRRFQEAEALFLQSLAAFEQALGENDPELLPVLENLRALAVSQGDTRQAALYAARIATLTR